MYLDRPTALPPFPIKSNSSFLISGIAVFALAAALIPNHANAFWLFDASANAASGGVTPSSSTPLLKAATNFDPNPDKGLGDSIPTSGNAVLAYTGPSGTIADVASSTPPDRISVYVVRRGDTLGEIAKMFNVSVNTIVWANNLSGAGDAHVGDTLVILPISGIERTIVKGDTLRSIARKYGGDAEEIAQYNGLDPAAPLEIGSTIIIPGGDITPPPSVPATKTKSTGKRVGSEPYLGGGGSAQPGYYDSPVPGAIITQGLHGWNGIDFGAARGTPIRAAADGTVIIARNNGGWNGGYGNYVVVTHDNGTQTLYAHMKNTIVSSGQSVSSGQVIGYLGSTGLSTGPHLHFEVRGAANPFRNCSLGSVCSPQ
ncbi:MAG: peptidoglycan DD-metalloendopeptidase family protein [Candidatus Paceibacterota bacterium]